MDYVLALQNLEYHKPSDKPLGSSITGVRAMTVFSPVSGLE